MTIQRPPSRQKLPDTAKKVHAGILFDVYQWEQELFDGSTATFEKVVRHKDTVSVYPVLDDGRILLTKQEQSGLGSFVGSLGGMIDPGEDPLAAAKRELLEESGLEADRWELWQSINPLEKIDWALYSFIARDCREVAAQALDPGEKIELYPVTFDEFLQIVLTPEFRDQETTVAILLAKENPDSWKRILATFGQEK